MTQDPSWNAWMARIQTLANAYTTTLGPLFTTDVDDLFAQFLAGFPQYMEVGDNELFEVRQYHNCHACRDFVNKYGALVCIDANGRLVSPFWSVADAPEPYKQAVSNMLAELESAIVTGVFYTSENVWGKPHTNRPVGEEWDHIAYVPQARMLHRDPLKTAHQAMAEKDQEFKSMLQALNDWSDTTIETALALLPALYQQGRAVKGIIEWLADLNKRFYAEKNDARAIALVWKAVATAPTGFCHLRGGMTGSLLDDIALGTPMQQVISNYDAKLHPLAYQRPTAPPKAGNVARAEAIVAQLGLANALKRRFADVSEAHAFWTPAPPRAAKLTPNAVTGVFVDVRTREVTLTAPPVNVTLPPTAMTMTRFMRDVLTHLAANPVTAIHYLTRHDHFAAIVAPVHADAPGLFQWNNPYNWYRYYAGSDPINWNLPPNTWVSVSAATVLPWQWDDDFRGTQFDKGVLFILPNCVDTTNSGSALFPGVLKADLHEVRATIEQYSNQIPLAQAPTNQAACGVLYRSGENVAPLTLRVTTLRNTQDITIDRWE